MRTPYLKTPYKFIRVYKGAIILGLALFLVYVAPVFTQARSKKPLTVTGKASQSQKVGYTPTGVKVSKNNRPGLSTVGTGNVAPAASENNTNYNSWYRQDPANSLGVPSNLGWSKAQAASQPAALPDAPNTPSPDQDVLNSSPQPQPQTAQAELTNTQPKAKKTAQAGIPPAPVDSLANYPGLFRLWQPTPNSVYQFSPLSAKATKIFYSLAAFLFLLGIYLAAFKNKPAAAPAYMLKKRAELLTNYN